MEIKFLAFALALAPSLAYGQYIDNRPRQPISGQDVVNALGNTKIPGIDSTASTQAAQALALASTASTQVSAALAAANSASALATALQSKIAVLTASVNSQKVSLATVVGNQTVDEATISTLTSGVAALNSNFVNVGSIAYNSTTNLFTVTSSTGVTGSITLTAGGGGGTTDTPPTIANLVNVSGPDINTLLVYPNITVREVDATPMVSIVVTVTDDATGTVTDANGTLAGTITGSTFTKTGTGTYSIAAQGPAADNFELRHVKFTPTPQQVLTGQTIVTDFTIVATKGTASSTPGVVKATVSGSGSQGGSGTVVGTTLNLTAPGTSVANIQGSTFSWAHQAGASVSGGGTGTLVITQPPHNGTSQAALWTTMSTSPSCYGTLMMNPSADFDYNTGMFVSNAAGTNITHMKDLYENDHSSNIWLQTETDFTGSNSQYPVTQEFLGYTRGSLFYMRVCKDNTNMTFEVSPTGADSSWVTLSTMTLSSLGNPTRVGFYADANNTGAGYNGVENTYYWQATANYTPLAAAYGGDPAMNMLVQNTPGNGWPTSDNAPVISGTTPKFSLALASGATNVMAYTFPGSGESTITIPDDATLRQNVYLSANESSLVDLTGWPMDNGQGPSPAFWAHYRSYPLGDPNSLTTVTTTGLKLKAHCFGPSFARYSVCGIHQVRAGFIRPVTVFRPGMTMEMVYIPATGYTNWMTWWLYSGEQKTPYPNSDPYAGDTPNGAGLSGQSNGPRGYNGTGVNAGSNIEIDINDNYPRQDYSGCVASNGQYGGQIDFGIPDIYATPWPTQPNGDTGPYLKYAADTATGSPVSWRHYGGGGTVVTSNNYWCEDNFVPGSTRTLLMNWRTDNTLDVFLNGKRIASAFMSYPQTQVFNGHQLGMNMLVGGQAVPVFDNNIASVVDNDGPSATSVNGDLGWTETVKSIKGWTGNLANPNCCDASTVNGAH